jgi:CDP-diglyceride synthetase
LCAGLLAALVPLAAGYGTGAAGAAILVVAAIGGAAQLGGAAVGATLSIAALLPAVAASSVVLALQADLWAALFLVLAVSLFDAGNYLLGAEAAGRWEGPVGGLIGALAVTFTIATIGVPPLDTAQWWVMGALVALTCPLGQWVTSALLPSPSAHVPAQRRLDAYVVAGPLLVAVSWIFGA